MPETFTHEIDVQFRDLDTRSHVNHVVYASYFEHAKERLYEEVLGVSLADSPTVVRSLSVDYRDSIPPDSTVTAELSPISVGKSSLTIDYELRVDGDVVATGQTVSVYLDEDGRPTAIPGDWRDALDSYE